ncbi:TAXI family TRAP transporter solute-binding subunit [Pseudaquabacterium pictum]|uniref:C4-dicarboxylate ABC transporter substrate-binding protein n=1 Tax=Pseudaquabacterium pictum TaxID=2315236 RepID=A0A480APK1_9BURK|nr:TAXI family TRAP transporter solute-binding subunit [Rubrivivax pictus]GCL62936.1 C4-dicarboxylate ABC transporter substrate-binding protein [Rubrivivax pictus]
MPKALQTTLLTLRELLFTAGPFALLAAGLLWAAYQLLQPNPPRTVVLATGVAQGAYDGFGKRYAELLARHGITVQLRNTQGSAENLALLQQAGSGVDIAFVQGGTWQKPAGTDPDADPGLQSLGRMFHEPIWLFYRSDSARRLAKAPQITRLAQLAGGTLNVGAPGSGVPPLLQALLEANRIAPGAITIQQQPTTPAVVDLLAGRIDALALASAPESLMVQMLLQTPGIALFDVAQAEAYSRRFAFLSPVVLPRGVADLSRDLPSADVRLLAPTASLVAREGLHPALVQLLVQAAQQVHGGAGWFQRKGDFPNAGDSEWPMAAEAERFYANGGPPWLQRFLPFWLANLADRMWLALLAIVAVLIPLARVLPPVYEFRIRRRVFRWYAQLRAVDEAVGQRPADALLAELADIETRVGQVTVPLSYADELYSLRSHIDMVRQRLKAG